MCTSDYFLCVFHLVKEGVELGSRQVHHASFTQVVVAVLLTAATVAAAVVAAAAFYKCGSSTIDVVITVWQLVWRLVVMIMMNGDAFDKLLKGSVDERLASQVS
jgi:uncharacterized membrane protein YcaP (DUF421 family)